ncbi:MAG: hypothetical protein A2X11_02650 [Bacteroidetes bacterium GWE2_42_24]|nr:MAG: hypothetical protein A2X11_02650 [Bacteroidetes bacterium GWE2_42_24]OFY32321.1 MAG: hypothetical protein A2X09_11855 [Bacteroidetes bacterium GWF2_43_11]
MNNIFINNYTFVNKYICNFVIMINDRISLVINHFGISPSQLATKIGVQRSGISHIMSGRNRPGVDFIIKLLQSFPQINSDWLLTGKGEMIKLSNADKVQAAQEILRFPESTSKSDYDQVKSLKTEKGALKQEEKTKSGEPRVDLTDTGHGITNMGTRASKIIILYVDGTYDEFHPAK